MDPDLRLALALVRAWRDPALPGLAFMVALVAAGFAAVGLGWAIGARNLYVALQMPAVVSGGMCGLALIGAGTALFATQFDRRAAARRQQIIGDLLDTVILLAATPDIQNRIRARRLVLTDGTSYHRRGCGMASADSRLSTIPAARRNGLRPCHACAPA